MRLVFGTETFDLRRRALVVAVTADADAARDAVAGGADLIDVGDPADRLAVVSAVAQVVAVPVEVTVSGRDEAERCADAGATVLRMPAGSIDQGVLEVVRDRELVVAVPLPEDGVDPATAAGNVLAVLATGVGRDRVILELAGPLDADRRRVSVLAPIEMPVRVDVPGPTEDVAAVVAALLESGARVVAVPDPAPARRVRDVHARLLDAEAAVAG